MPWEKDKKKRLAEYLWAEINKAILKSPDVQLAIKKLEKLQLLDYVAEFNLVLEVDKLIESILKKGAEKEAEPDSIHKETQLHDEHDPEEKALPNISSVFSSKSKQWVDGSALSENEILFEEYLNRGFDEKHWMEKAKIRFDS
ncbi:MAG: hypothetical protein H8E42_06330 [Nitrospinae bacterium]|nr:hypothetical protein [Nitrospinota bacterium]MBL7019507.1 hypothetical protein [Nitrospinaceae bacterium]